MKHLTIAFASAALLALGACNSEQEAANDVNGSIGNGVLPVENGAAAATNAVDGGKPVDTGTAGTDSAAPAGDKPAADPANAAAEAPAGDKPQ